MRKKSKKSIKNALDKQWAEEVKIRAGYRCEFCKKTTYLNSHHIFSRKNLSVRHDAENGVCLCAGCHMLSSTFSAHQTPVEFVEWIKNYRGIEWYDRLRSKANKIKKSIDKQK